MSVSKSPTKTVEANTNTSKTADSASTTTNPATGAVVQGPKNHVRISLSKNKFTYVDLTKYLLNEGESFVELSGMGDAMTNVIEIAEILKSQGAVEVIEIETSRATEKPHGVHVDRIRVRVQKTSKFAEVFAEQQKEKEQRKEKEKAAAATATTTTTTTTSEGKTS